MLLVRAERTVRDTVPLGEAHLEANLKVPHA
jgi:hypothetical protein